MKSLFSRSSSIHFISLCYLLLPFLIFCLTFLKIWIGLPVVIILGWVTWRIWRHEDSPDETARSTKKELVIGILILGAWVFLSGIGGYAFQNMDHLTRNTIFNDLINNRWPVYYLQATNGQAGSVSALMYYIGYWFPAALVGKLFGWQIANLTLFLWTFLGVFITVVHLKKQIKASLVAASLLLIFFSGMDILGTVSIRAISANGYPSIWPPIQTIEWWVAGSFQYSSFTTQLFWVFNQAIPAWIAIALTLATKNPRIAFFIWALCFFSAPIPAIGLLPFALLIVPSKSFTPENIGFGLDVHRSKEFLGNCLIDIKAILTPENIFGGGIVLFVSYFFFSANPNGTQISLVIKNILVFMFYIIFLTYEFALLWLLFYKEKRLNLWWYVVGGSLIIIPLIRLGTFTDFCMRASIPALFILMVWSGEALFRIPRVKYRGALIIILVIGALTPLYEINRSLYRTSVYYLNRATETQLVVIPGPSKPGNILPEYAHPTSLTEDVYASVLDLKPDVVPNYVGNIENSFFFTYLAKPP